MQKRKRYTWFFVAVILLVFYISFFYMERTEISDVDLLLVVGIDKTEDGYHVTGLYKKNGGVEEATGGTKLIDGTGRTFYEAYQDLQRKNLKNVSIAHATFFVFGEGAAKSGMSQCLDYIERDQTVKMDAMVYILKDMSVNSFMEKTLEDETQLSQDLNAINEKQLDQQRVVDNTIVKIAEQLEQTESQLYIPYLVSEDKDLYIDGYGVIKKDSLVAFLDHDQSLTLDFLRNRLRSYPIYLQDEIGLEVTDSWVSREVNIVNGKLVATLTIDFNSDIKEVTTTDHVYENYYIKQIEYLQNEYMADKITSLIHVGEKYQLDLVNVAEMIQKDYSKDWETIVSKWRYYFGDITYEFNITSQAAQSYVVSA